MNINGWIIYNGSLPGDKFIDFAEMFYNAALKKGTKASIFKNNEILSFLNNNEKSVLIKEEDSLPDYVIMTDKDLNLARQFEMMGISVFNSSKAIEVSDDKIQTHQILTKHRIPNPKTIICPLIYFGKQSISNDLIDEVIKQLQFPMIIKESFGSFGKQVYLVENKKELIAKIEMINDKPFLFQEFVHTSYGRDLRLQVVGDKVVAAMKRTAVNDFRANVTNGGKMQAYEPNEEEKEIAIKALKAVGADFGGVDLLYGPNDTPLVCEINANAHIRNLYDCTGINSANYIMEYIVEQILKEKNT